MKVLVIDDERAIRYSLKEILEMEGYQVETAENGEEGLQKAQRKSTTPFSATSKCPSWTARKCSQRLLRKA